MTWWRWLRTTWRSERGAQPLDYVGVTGVAMVVAGMIIVGIMAARGQLGAQMARVHAHIIASFEQGRGGTINHNHWLELPPRPGFTPVQPGWRVPGAPIGEQLPPPASIAPQPPGGWPWERDEGTGERTPPSILPPGWDWRGPPENRNRPCLDYIEFEITHADGSTSCHPVLWPVLVPEPFPGPSTGLVPSNPNRPPLPPVCLVMGPFGCVIQVRPTAPNDPDPPGPTRPDNEEERPSSGGSGRPPASPDGPREPDKPWDNADGRGGEDTPREEDYISELPDQPVGSLKVRNERYWQQQGIDPHQVKREIVGGQVSRYNLGVDRDGNVWVLRRGEHQSRAIYVGPREEVRKIYPPARNDW